MGSFSRRLTRWKKSRRVTGKLTYKSITETRSKKKPLIEEVNCASFNNPKDIHLQYFIETKKKDKQHASRRGRPRKQSTQVVARNDYIPRKRLTKQNCSKNPEDADLQNFNSEKKSLKCKNSARPTRTKIGDKKTRLLEEVNCPSFNNPEEAHLQHFVENDSKDANSINTEEPDYEMQECNSNNDKEYSVESKFQDKTIKIECGSGITNQMFDGDEFTIGNKFEIIANNPNRMTQIRKDEDEFIIKTEELIIKEECEDTPEVIIAEGYASLEAHTKTHDLDHQGDHSSSNSAAIQKIVQGSGNNCEICKIQCSDRKQLTEHLRTSHKRMICHICQQVIDFKDIPDHFSMHKPMRYQCNCCKECFSQKRLLISHQRHKHNLRTNVGKGSFPCTICSNVYSSKKNLEYHMNSRVAHINTLDML